MMNRIGRKVRTTHIIYMQEWYRIWSAIFGSLQNWQKSRSFGYQMTLVCVYTEIQIPLINNHRIGLELPYSTFNFGTFCIHIAQCIMGYYVNYTNRAPIEFSSTNLKLNCKVWQLWFRRRNNLYFVAYKPTTLFTNLIRYCIIYAILFQIYHSLRQSIDSY